MRLDDHLRHRYDIEQLRQHVPHRRDQGEVRVKVVSEPVLVVFLIRSAPDQEYDEDRFGHHFDANFALIAAMRNMLPQLLNVIAMAQVVVKAHERYQSPGERLVSIMALRTALEALEATT